MAVILLVEDELRLLELLAGVLRREGYVVQEAEDGLEAICRLDQAQDPDAPDLVVLDIILPRVDGLGVLTHLAARGRSLPVVAMSIKPELLADAKAAGAQSTLQMPFALSDLLDVVRTCLTQSSDGPA